MESPDKLPTYYPMFCVWCEAEGMRTITGYSTIPHSSGICQMHAAEMMESVSRGIGESETTDTDLGHDRYEAQPPTSL